MNRSILVISPDRQLLDSVESMLVDQPGLRVDTRPARLTEMNGQAVKLATDYDMILFQTSGGDAAELKAAADLATGRRSGTMLVALADAGLSITDAHALTRAGIDQVLPVSILAEELPESVERLRQKRGGGDGGRPGRIVAVAPARGGVGATTVAVNLADQIIARTARGQNKPRVALLDLDLQFGTVGSYLDLPEQEILLRIAADGTIPDATFLRQSMAVLPSGLSVLAAPTKFAPLEALRSEQIAGLLDALTATHDYVVVDLPRALVSWIEPVVRRADEMMIVTDVAVSSVRHCRRLIDFFTADNIALPVQVVINHESKPFFASALHREAARVLERPLEHWLPHDPKAAHNAADRGQPLSAVAARSSLAKAIGRLASDTLTRFPAAIRTKEAH
ncbi:pilus assembly protein CpaE [Cereibacter ovatus]|uniref:Pilus assembly protein CpaE n=1 Tax=Cereibacter ovatus TaxID=439529 RepID=A0A285CSU4_9RHOB|nr:AAA family ATPase [Cereibacter ovatus]SNX70602.1 pilus assembly protein CpaE [Cereibacter ovatus]